MGPSGPSGTFGRFRLSEFSKPSHNTAASAPAGQCSRFRVSDFVQYDSSGSHSNGGGGGGGGGGGAGAVGGAVNSNSNGLAAGPATPERLQKSPTMNTTPVNGVGAGSPTMTPAQSGFGMLRMETQTAGEQQQQQPPPPPQQQLVGKEQGQGTGNVSLLLYTCLRVCAYTLDVDGSDRVPPRGNPFPSNSLRLRFPYKLRRRQLRRYSLNPRLSSSIRWSIRRSFDGS